jgi:type III secretion protein R
MQAAGFDPFSLLLPLLALGLVPFAAVMVTAYTKLVVVFALLRNALGIQQVPPNIVLNSLALIFTAFIMAPVGMETYDILRSKGMLDDGRMRTTELLAGLSAAKEPLRKFMVVNGKERERKFFLKSAQRLWPAERTQDLKETDFLIAVPAFTVSELTAAFQIGFVLYVCFIAVDLILANILLALGMSMVSPTLISVPFKLLLFTVIDGWSLLLHNLVLTYKL